MVTVKDVKTKVLVILIVFMLIFSNCGFTLEAVATSDEFQVITNGFFKKDEIKFEAYFEDENGNQITEMTSNVNQKSRLILEILPQVEGYLKTADLKVVSEDGSDVNFKIAGVSYYEENTLEDTSLSANQNVDLSTGNEESKVSNEVVESESVTSEDVVDSEENKVSNSVNSESAEETTNEITNEAETLVSNSVVETGNLVGEISNEVVENEISNETVNEVEDSVANKVSSEVSNSTNESVANEVSNVVENTTNAVEETTNTIENEVSNEVSNKTVENEISNTVVENEVNSEDVLIDEDQVIEEKTEENETEETQDLAYDMKVVSDSEVEIKNVIKDTKIVLELEYNMGETLKVSDLMKTIHLQLSGTYINSDLEEVEVAKEEIVTLGWEYTKDITLTSEYTKFSPFEVGDIKGTIVENKITVERNVTEEKYLPIKSTSIEVGVPEVNGKKPTEISVVCEKLLATRGEDTGYTTFGKDNWTYDAENGKLEILVENTNLVYTSGMDEYVIIYRYEDKIDEENSNLSKIVTAKIEEYSANNNIITKQINENQSIKVDVGELVTYNISTSEGKINKAKIYANYNSEEPVYETEYTNQINVNILTSDILEELKINCNQEIYKDANGYEFKAEGIEYKKIKFSYSEITTLLVNGGEIVITNEAGDTLYTLNKDVITSEEDCEISLNSVTGIIVYARNIAKNGNLNFEVTKAIKTCNYEKSAFKNFTSIESRISAEVKYQKIDERLALQTIGVAKEFEESSTYASISLNKETLSTTKSNDNVEIKIELNNDKEDSDLYINPAFEIVFPKYVNSIEIQNVNVLYENGLKVKTIDTYEENDIQKIRVELEGKQKTFSESTITNGTNIIVNVNIDVDDYTPKKEDQIKLYYCNEGVSTYQSQTKWSISKQIPNDILKTTNGFDVAIIEYQAPDGLVAINGIVNYDGMLSEVKSVKQGEVKQQIETNDTSKIMTMELLALNNTENKCTDVVLLGRIPFEGVKDVITNEDLGTTTSAVMKDLIKEDITNTNTVDIYYSSNGNATKDLDNIGNGWTKEVSSVSEVKSFLIVVKGNMEAGQVLRYTYDFEVPANLPYETNIEGSFGAFYNNNTDVAVVYESSIADTVGLVTEAGPKLEATLSVDAGDGNNVGECRFLTYTISVKNTGSVTATGITVTNPIPNYTVLYEYDTSDLGLGNNNWTETSNVSTPTWTIETLAPDEEKTFSFMVKTGKLQSTDEEIVIKSQATVTASNLGIEIQSNETSNKLEKRNFDLMINTDTFGSLEIGQNIQYKATAVNISGETLENLKIECKIPEEMTYTNTLYTIGQGSTLDEEKITFDETTNTVTVIVDKLLKSSYINIKFGATATSGSKETTTSYVSFVTEDNVEEKTSDVPIDIIGPYIEVSQVANAETVLEGQNIEFAILIENNGTGEAKGLQIKDTISTYLENVSVKLFGNSNSSTALSLTDGNLESYLGTLATNSQYVITISGVVSDLPDGMTELTVSNQATISGKYIADTLTNVSEVIVKENPDKVEEKKEEDTNTSTNTVNTNTTNEDNSNTTNNASYYNNETTNQTINYYYSTSTETTTTDTNSTTTITDTTNADNTTSTTQEETVEEATYSISGKVWFDENKDGICDSNEGKIPTVKVQLYENGNVTKAVTTDGNGEYSFSGVENGKYIVTFEYNSDKYVATTYKVSGATEAYDSDAIETESGKAITNSLTVENGDLSNIDLGLKSKDTFDLSIEKYLTSATVTTAKSTKTYDFENEKLSKIEIRSKEIEGAEVELEYLIELENVGDVNGEAIKIVDQFPEGMTFDENENEGWYLGTDGNLYNETLKETTMEPGDKLELKLVLTKKMNSENTGTALNKVIMQETSNILDLTEDTENDVSTNEVMILISTNGNTMAIFVSIVAIIMFLIIYMNRAKIDIAFNKKYKNTTKIKSKMKKIYK